MEPTPPTTFIESKKKQAIEVLDVKLEGLFNDAVRQTNRFVRKEQTQEEMNEELASLNKQGIKEVERAFDTYTSDLLRFVEGEVLRIVGNSRTLEEAYGVGKQESTARSQVQVDLLSHLRTLRGVEGKEENV